MPKDEMPTLGELEARVLQLVWDHQPCTERQVCMPAQSPPSAGRRATESASTGGVGRTGSRTPLDSRPRAGGSLPGAVTNGRPPNIATGQPSSARAVEPSRNRLSAPTQQVADRPGMPSPCSVARFERATAIAIVLRKQVYFH